MASQILRVSIKGAMPGGEVWSTNPCWEIDGTSGQLVTQGDALAIATALGAVTVPSDLLGFMGTGTTVTGYRVEARKLTGTLDAQADFSLATPAAGNGTQYKPHGTAIVLSLRTPGVGASSRGRMYWPATGAAIQSTDYRISSANVALGLTAFKSYLTALESKIKLTLPNANLTVWSRKTANFHDVNSLQLGNVLDSQRRRRDALIEGYQAVTYP